MNERLFSGEKIYGDDFSRQQIEQWYKEEEYAYSNLGYVDCNTTYYPYHALNRKYGWKHAEKRNFDKALSIGGAFAEEFAPIIDRVNEIHVVEPAEKFYRDRIHGKPAYYRKPDVSGTLPYAAGSFELVTCFGVLHHIPNVSYVFSELTRVLAKGGLLLIREPIISMGDWRMHRVGLTKNERGIPLHIFYDLIEKNALSLLNHSVIGFSPLLKLALKARVNVWNSNLLLGIDHSLCRITQFNYQYHREKVLQKICPTGAYFALSKP